MSTSQELLEGGPNSSGVGTFNAAAGRLPGTPATGSCAEISHMAALASDIGSLAEDEATTDVTLVVAGTAFRAHRAILAARSAYFRALLFGGMRETGKEAVELPGVHVAAFRLLLRYLYTGQLSLPELPDESILELLGLAHRFNFACLESDVCEYLKSIVCPRNLAQIYAAAFLYSLDSLLSFAVAYADRHASEVVSSAGWTSLSGAAVLSLLRRDSFCAPEIELFHAVAAWARANPSEDLGELIAALRLSLIKLDDLLTTVRSSDLVPPDLVLDAIKEQRQRQNSELPYRGYCLEGVNVATTAQGAKVVEGEIKHALLNGDTCNYDMERGFTRHPIEAHSEGIVVKLGATCIINHLRLLLWDRDARSYSYYVELSVDQEDWVRVVDYSAYLCRAWQRLHFPPRPVRYIRVCGTLNTVNRVFHLIACEAYYRPEAIPREPEHGILIPPDNVATIADSAIVTEGVSRCRNALLNGDTSNYDWDSGYTCHQLGSGSIQIQLPQPYIIDSMRLLLWDCDSRYYSFYVDVSTDGRHWTRVADRSNDQCRSWQLLRFYPLTVCLVRIVGTANSANEVFHIVHFEAPASPPYPPLDPTTLTPAVTRVEERKEEPGEQREGKAAAVVVPNHPTLPGGVTYAQLLASPPPHFHLFGGGAFSVASSHTSDEGSVAAREHQLD